MGLSAMASCLFFSSLTGTKSLKGCQCGAKIKLGLTETPRFRNIRFGNAGIKERGASRNGMFGRTMRMIQLPFHQCIEVLAMVFFFCQCKDLEVAQREKLPTMPMWEKSTTVSSTLVALPKQ